jgi:hypothetical protein
VLCFCEKDDETPVSMKHNECYNQKAGRILIPEEIYAVEVFNYNVISDCLVLQQNIFMVFFNMS